ncbi:MAG: NUDIX domain-containing protein [Phycisphaerales bacterium]|nr:MAG: NUDIX domain-containing protein [Phycisphaerales bacterium]
MPRTFNFCPSCGSRGISFDGIKEFTCAKCSFTYFHNVAIAAGTILEYDSKIVLIRRKEEPGRGMLDLPGGFIEPAETAEEGARREIKEELKIDVGPLQYLGSYPNTYEFKDVSYCSCDLLFYCRIEVQPMEFDGTEAEEVVLMDPFEINDDEIAFESIRMGLRLFRRLRSEVGPADK